MMKKATIIICQLLSILTLAGCISQTVNVYYVPSMESINDSSEERDDNQCSNVQWPFTPTVSSNGVFYCTDNVMINMGLNSDKVITPNTDLSIPIP